MANHIGDNSTIQSLQVALDGLVSRHKAISSNIANVNTPNHKRSSVSFENELAYAQGRAKKPQIPLVKTDSGHINLGFNKNIKSIKPRTTVDTSTSIHSNGNNVDVDKELVELAKTGMRFKVNSKMTKKYFEGINQIINGST